MLMGDAPQEVEEYLVGKEGMYEDGPSTKKSQLKSDVLKLGHHGSRTSTSPLFLAVVKPSWTIVSRGCDNTYGHPHTEVVDIVQKFGAQILDTCIHGTVVFESDGKGVVRK
jgi:beta-lactamase superfamily II metal-dependent hydrolase